ncbi:hypothetical protein EVJ58_g5496 [Rhodofomes roseus]|uniref:dual-specificity kinase n=1 Tax=Rhodofomes roseus TaxID=34475 RepID=A0A4Y9YC30_9APHY|nr:hypothetical protein EVJ58_g5496 [Rhodofomes roseus]
MSAPPSPNIGQVAHDKGRTKRRDRPPALNVGDPKSTSDGDVRYERDHRRDAQRTVPRTQKTVGQNLETDAQGPRSPSATSSLDPYYFSVQSPPESPIPPLPTSRSMPRTPEMHTVHEPVTPGRDPAAIDRRGLVGVGELATPRWVRGPRHDEVEIDEQLDEVEEEPSQGEDGVVMVDEEQDLPDSPWTIEAIDGEPEENDDLLEVQPISRPLRSRRSVADESGGEEILYPRHPLPIDDRRRAEGPNAHVQDMSSLEDATFSAEFEPVASMALQSETVSPPSAFAASTNRPRKRTSDEFEMDHAGMLVAKSTMASNTPKDKEKVRRHKSLGVPAATAALVREKVKDRRRDTLSINVKHQRQTSASSSSSSHGDAHPSRRIHASDFSHLPPSPSSSSIQQFLKQSGTGSKTTSPSHHPLKEKDSSSHLPSNMVAHSLLRGTQEGWSDLDDQATMEALRKLDGLSGRSARARSSIGAHSRLGSSSRPSTPAGASGQWEGIEGGRSSKRLSTHAAKDRTKGEHVASQRQTVGLGIAGAEVSVETEVHGTTSHSGEELHSNSPLPEKSSLKKSNSITRSSLSAKRGSASSGTYTSTPTTSSRDSATLSISTSATSVSVSSGRQSSNKAKRNSASSEMSGFSGEASYMRDRAASLAGAAESSDEQRVPPVPPLPKDISSYKQQPQTPSTVVSPAPEVPGSSRSKRETVSDMRFQSSLEVPSFPSTPSKHASLQVQKSVTTPTSIQKTPSKKWSFSNVMGKKLSNSPSISSMNEAAARSPGLPISPRTLTFGAQLRKSVSKDRTRSPTSKASADDWSPINSAMASATSLASVSSVGSTRGSLRDPPVAWSLTACTVADAGSLGTQPIGNRFERQHQCASSGTPQSFVFPAPSSRRSLHSDREKSDSKSVKDTSSSKDSDRESKKKDDKDRSESRISVLMGRKRGKTLSSAQPTPRKAEPMPLPPMQISALPAATAQRVASLKSTSSSSSSSNPSSSATARLASSRATSQTASSMQKQSDSSLRGRNQLPTIAGSPSVGSINSQVFKEPKEPPPSSSLNPTSSLTKDTPTKIPRISSRSSTTNSPTLKGNGAGRRASLLVGSSALSGSRGSSPAATAESMNEFGVLENGHAAGAKTATTQRHSVRASPSTSSRVPRQVSAPTSSTTNGTIPRKNRESMSFAGLRKSSTGSVASISSVAQQNDSGPSHRFSALSPSKGLKLLSPKLSLPTSRSSNSSSTHSIQQAMASPSSSRQSLSTPSPAPSSIDEDELLGDEEMMQYIKRQHAKKLASGANQEDLDAMLKFPEPIPPTTAVTPAALLKSTQAQYLSDFEKREMLDYPSVYCYGAHSDKKPATVDNATNNHGYDDDRGDYLVVNHDHLAYRYEVIDTLGKGSFGQVLHCRDHCTGESVAVKIIRNKKRFHHQALVEIKILDNLRKWDQEEKHHVIKMTEHFYFRNHLCIATELLSINLYELIKANGFVGFTTALIRRFTSQMLQSLSLMRHHHIVHCDLKPENVLLKHPAKSAIKVIDFGSSCFEHEKIYTYIQSRFYRSPEVILGMNYHMAIDMWSLGCILAELYTGFPIFPGENEQEQLSCIMEVLGVPDKDFINRSSRKRLFFGM